MRSVTTVDARPPSGHVWHPCLLPSLLLIVGVSLLAACGGTSSNTSSATAKLNAGLRAQQKGDYVTAAADYKMAIALDPHNKFAYYDLGDVDQLTGQPAAAEQNYRACLQIDPNFVPALYNLGILRTSASPAEAEELYRHVISLQSNDAAAHLNLGFLLRSEGRTAEGNTELQTAIALDPSLASRIPPGTLATPAPGKRPSPSPSP
jgi:tetratricopeptide (TPR) repeat protein